MMCCDVEVKNIFKTTREWESMARAMIMRTPDEWLCIFKVLCCRLFGVEIGFVGIFMVAAKGYFVVWCKT